MTPTVQVGTILIADRPQIAQFLSLASEPYSGKWNVVQGLDGFAMDRKIHRAGWNFFFMAGEIKVNVLWNSRDNQDAERGATNSRKSEAARLQLP